MAVNPYPANWDNIKRPGAIVKTNCRSKLYDAAAAQRNDPAVVRYPDIPNVIASVPTSSLRVIDAQLAGKDLDFVASLAPSGAKLGSPAPDWASGHSPNRCWLTPHIG